MIPGPGVLLVVSLMAGGVLTADCGSLSSCTACMSQTECVWCRDPNTNLTDRCRDPALGQVSCSQDMLVDIESSVKVLQDKPLSPDSVENFVQISPQLLSVSLRPGRPVSVEFQVAHAKQFPVDLYFLMDLSWSMRDSITNLANLGGEIIAGIKRKTGNLAIGFGSFVEKNVAPFTSGIASFNCLTGEEEDCSPPYSYHHKASLADIQAEEFKRAVLSSPLGDFQNYFLCFEIFSCSWQRGRSRGVSRRPDAGDGVWEEDRVEGELQEDHHRGD